MAFCVKGTHNRIQVIGRLGSDPELKHTQGGTAVCNVSIATNEKSGEREITSWHRCTLWGKKAEAVAQYCRKGSKLMVEGPMQYREYNDRDGNKRLSAEVDVENFIFLDGKPEGGGGQQQGGWSGGQQQQQQQQQQGGGGGGQSKQQQVDDDDDIPF